jgi:hypothetical protein
LSQKFGQYQTSCVLDPKVEGVLLRFSR